ncbi:MAG: type II secretion system protein [Alphaproteobacteria bacterium]
MLRRFHQRKGFTLIELAIVVGVAGLLFSGLWRLMSSGSSQLREQAAADQINQVVSATRNFLASQQGQGLLTLMGPGTAQELTLPDAGGCPGALPANQNTYCNFTPAGFTGATANSFNQTYRVFARKLSGAVNAAAANYDFVVFTTGGDIIPDASGGRISANIGASGGFIYADASVCATPLATLADNAACGAFGGFALNLLAAPPTGLSLVASPLSGHIVTLNGSGTSNTNNSPWLARTNLPNDTGFFFNTMQENLFMEPTNG